MRQRRDLSVSVSSCHLSSVYYIRSRPKSSALFAPAISATVRWNKLSNKQTCSCASFIYTAHQKTFVTFLTKNERILVFSLLKNFQRIFFHFKTFVGNDGKTDKKIIVLSPCCPTASWDLEKVACSNVDLL